jgi:hypothetical protein
LERALKGCANAYSLFLRNVSLYSLYYAEQFYVIYSMVVEKIQVLISSVGPLRNDGSNDVEFDPP